VGGPPSHEDPAGRDGAANDLRFHCRRAYGEGGNAANGFVLDSALKQNY